MSAKRKPARVPAALGLRAQKGGAVIVGVALDAGAPRVVVSTFLATAADGDRLALEPYHAAAALPRGAGGGPSAEAAAAVAEGRRRQEALAVDGLGGVVRRLQDAGCAPAAAALLVNRAGWVTDLLAYSLEFREHAAVAEGLAVRDALRAAIARHGLEAAEMDEKSLPETAAHQLGLAAADIEARLKALGATAGKPWRKEQKLACLAAWVAARA